MLHMMVLAVVVKQWPETKKAILEPTPKHIIADVVQVESAAEKERKRQAALQKERQLAAAKRAAEQKKLAEQRRLAEQKKLAEAKALAKKEAALKLAAEKKAKEAALKAQSEKMQAEKKIAEQKKAEEQAQKQRQLDDAWRTQQLAAEQALLDELLLQELALAEQAQEQAQREADRAMALESEYIDVIRDHVTTYWRFPSSAKPEQEVEVHIVLVPTGQVIQVTVIKSSGSPLLDRSVEQAIQRASPLPVPQDSQVFERSFRSFKMKFRPENATW